VTYCDANGPVNTSVFKAGITSIILSYGGKALAPITVDPVKVKVIWQVGTNEPIEEIYDYNAPLAYKGTNPDPNNYAPQETLLRRTDGLTAMKRTNTERL
jgi:hypothetical protein